MKFTQITEEMVEQMAQAAKQEFTAVATLWKRHFTQC